MKINPLGSYEEAKYPSVKDLRSKKRSRCAKSGVAIVMASLTALAMSNCNPIVIETTDSEPPDLGGTTFTTEITTKRETTIEITEKSEDPTLAGGVVMTETNPRGNE